ncbi:hypothetical protein O5274_27245, partial [Escherichia coli]|nr:hypothetical protein [Escherichia coli]
LEGSLFVCVGYAFNTNLLDVHFLHISVNQVPLFLTLLGHKDAAEIQKAEILRGEDGFSFPVINFLIKYFPLYFYYSTLIGLFK